MNLWLVQVTCSQLTKLWSSVSLPGSACALWLENACGTRTRVRMISDNGHYTLSARTDGLSSADSRTEGLRIL